MERRPAVVLLSGGLDSATALAVARREGYRCHALTVAYGQRHAAELEAAARVAALMPGLKERARTLVELADSARFLVERPAPDAKAAALLTPDARAMLADLARRLAATDFTAPALDAALRRFAEAHGRKLGQVAQPLRAALTGSATSPPIDATLAALGREESLARLASA